MPLPTVLTIPPQSEQFPSPPPQVTNPAIDPLREAVVTSLRCFIGPEKDITASGAEHTARLDLLQVRCGA